MKKLHPRTYNLLMLPVVLIVRTPIMLPLAAIVWLGEKAEKISEAIGRYLPGFRYNPESRSRF